MYFIRYIIYDWIIVIGYSKHELGTINMLCPPNYKGMKKGKKWQPEKKKNLPRKVPRLPQTEKRT